MISIFAPYTRSETTYAATQLADFCLSLGHEVSFQATGVISQGVHSHWDKQSKAALTKPCSAAVWFGDNVTSYESNSRVSPGAKRILVPSWSNEKDTEPGCGQPHYHYVVSSSFKQQNIRMQKFATDTAPRAATKWAVVPWCPSPATDVTVKPASNNTVLLTAHASAIRQAPETIIDLLELLLDQPKSYRIILWSQSSWPRVARKSLRRVAADHDKRIEFASGLPIDGWGQMLTRVKYHVCLEATTDFAIFQTESIRYGLPTMAYPSLAAQPVYSSSSWLIPCESYESASGTMRNSMDSLRVLNCFKAGLTSNASPEAVSQSVLRYKMMHEVFKDSWSTLLEKVDGR